MSSRKQGPEWLAASGVPAEIGEIVGYIHALRNDLADLGGSPGGRITDARVELGAVMQTTENAANTIMDACDYLRAATRKSAANLRIGQAIDAIYEACSFQDLTSQRVVKVRRTLDVIEQRICEVAAKLGVDTTGVIAPAPPVAIHDGNDDAWLLNGPAMPGEGVGQGDVDKFFG